MTTSKEKTLIQKLKQPTPLTLGPEISQETKYKILKDFVDYVRDYKPSNHLNSPILQTSDTYFPHSNRLLD